MKIIKYNKNYKYAFIADKYTFTKIHDISYKHKCERITLYEAIDEWLYKYVKVFNETTTFQHRYDEMKNLKKYIRNKKLRNFNIDDINKFILKNQQCCNMTQHNRIALLRNMLNRAVDWGYVDKNFLICKSFRCLRKKKDIDIRFDKQYITALLDAYKDTKIYLAVALAVATRDEKRRNYAGSNGKQ